MPPVPRGQKAPDGPSARDIANANSTVNAFLGTRRPAWLSGGSNSPRGLRSILSTTSTSTIPFNASQRPDNQSDVTVTNSESPIHVNTETFENIPAAPFVLPSPAPTNDRSPATSLGLRSPDEPNHAISSHTDSASIEAVHPYDVARIRVTTVPYNRGSSNPPATVSVNHAAACTDVPAARNHQSPSISSRVPIRPSISRPLQHESVPSPNPSDPNRLTTTETQASRTSSKRNSQNLGASEPAAKRLSSGTPSSSEVPRRNTSQLVASVHRQVASWSSLTLSDSQNTALRQRYKLLEQAAAAEDWWYLILHCLFSRWHLDGAHFYEDLCVSEDVAKQLNESLHMLECLIPGANSLDSRHRQWLALFPATSITQLRSTNASDDFYRVMDFLRRFASEWSYWPTKVAQRGYPLMIYEFRRMNCTSPLMQTIVVSYLAQYLGASSGLPELLQELAEDREYEKLVPDDSIRDEDRSRSRCTRASRYRVIIQNHRKTLGPSIHGQHTSGRPSSASPFAEHALQQGHSGGEGALTEFSPSPRPQQEAQQQRQGQGQVQIKQSRQQRQSSTSSQPIEAGLQRSQNPWALGSQYKPRQPQQQQWSSPTRLPSVTQAQAQSQSGNQVYSSSSQQGHPLPQPQPRLSSTPVAGRSSTTIGVSSPSFTVMSPYPSPDLQSTSSFSNNHSAIALNSRTTLPTLQNQSIYAAQHSVHFDASSTSATSVPSIQPQTTQYQNATVTSVQSNFRVIQPNDFPDNTWNWTSLERGLHLVRQRSPIREPRVPTTARFYQYVSQYAVTKVLTPRIGVETIDFEINDHIFESLVRMQLRHGLERCVYWEGSQRVRLRLCKYPENGTNFETIEAPVTSTYWPENIYISLNGEPLQLRRKQHFRTDWPAEITHIIRRGRNTVVMSLPESAKPRQGSQKYLLMVEIVSISSAETLKALVFRSEHLASERTKTELQRRLAGSCDDDIVIQDKHLSISITDPFSSTMCITPVRSLCCRHVECFDLDNWLDTRQTKPSKRLGEPSKVDEWKCPICGSDARPHQLRVDDFFVEVREKLLVDGADRTRMIQVDDQGNWSAVVEQDDSDDDNEVAVPAVNLGQPKAQHRSRSGPAVIVLDDD